MEVGLLERLLFCRFTKMLPTSAADVLCTHCWCAMQSLFLNSCCNVITITNITGFFTFLFFVCVCARARVRVAHWGHAGTSIWDLWMRFAERVACGPGCLYGWLGGVAELASRESSPQQAQDGLGSASVPWGPTTLRRPTWMGFHSWWSKEGKSRGCGKKRNGMDGRMNMC